MKIIKIMKGSIFSLIACLLLQGCLKTFTSDDIKAKTRASYDSYKQQKLVVGPPARSYAQEIAHSLCKNCYYIVFDIKPNEKPIYYIIVKERVNDHRTSGIVDSNGYRFVIVYSNISYSSGLWNKAFMLLVSREYLESNANSGINLRIYQKYNKDIYIPPAYIQGFLSALDANL